MAARTIMRGAALFIFGFILGSFLFHSVLINMQKHHRSGVVNEQGKVFLPETSSNINKAPEEANNEGKIHFEKKIDSTNMKSERIDILAEDDREKFYDANYWEMAPHYNIDDYGTPVEEYMLSVENMKSMSKEERVKKFKDRNIKTVLYMHMAYGSKTYGFNYNEHSKQGQWPYIMKGCRRRDCFCTDQRDFIPIEEFDAIVFYSRAISKADVPAVRKPHQRYILWEVEPVTYLMGFNPSQWQNFFNWTHTYRRDSDLWEPWGVLNQAKPYPKPVDTLIEERKADTSLAATKKKSIAWFVSNCNAHSGRDRYAKELQKYIPVDIYGGCGPLRCDRSQTGKCWENVERDYYFYFSAENSLCKDYITEKFLNALKKNIVPIVFGGGQGTNDYYFAPKKSFINTYDYKSPKELAEYLLKLQKDHAEYVSYFWWKPYYNIWLGRWKKAHCEICDKLHANEPSKVYKDMQDWWVTQSKCRPPYS
ncbi:alpha-(1,3)-fucosyltransferase C-like [Hydractinia symbiolongicarpus]|uniref:alpha-(1,3)-fucosyltransferase C-like n=1 Tax=Hydractinia symbiolongicarpus TaxID=13093 RepID=UPI00254C7073|nr:alpha-(1,3)-fucosyltransferase C-like [Hydractinia symbiolongicarpus]XP_057303504.1 alpha-(1,3)-fucosyltransferase C-like [Hydractinia symbiolongicarpus]